MAYLRQVADAESADAETPLPDWLPWWGWLTAAAIGGGALAWWAVR